MFKANPNFKKLHGSYLFSEVARRAQAYIDAHPGAEVIRLGIGDVTRPLAPAVIEAMEKAFCSSCVSSSSSPERKSIPGRTFLPPLPKIVLGYCEALP